jgi:hypothetical protein
MKISKRLLQEGIVQDYFVNSIKGDFTHEVWDKKSPHFLDFKYFISDGVAENKVGLVTLTKVTHGMRPTQNNLIYMPSDLKDAIPTLTSPYNIPIKPMHKEVAIVDGKKIENREVGAVGRAMGGTWVDNPKAAYNVSSTMIKDGLILKAPDVAMAPYMKKLAKSGMMTDEDFEGLGWVLVKGLVTDPEAVEKTLDGRYLTVSVEMTPNDLYDSISGKSYKTDEMEWDIGDDIDGTKAYGVPSGLRYRGYAYVTHPADVHARVMNYKEVGGDALQQYLDNFKTTMVVTDCFKNAVTDISDSEIMASFDNGPVATVPVEIADDYVDLYSQLSEEEKALADSLMTLANKVGPLDKAPGIWVGYESGPENENLSIGVKCGNCALHASENRCKIISQTIEPDGYCRFAVIPDGLVSANKTEPMEDQTNLINQEEQEMPTVLSEDNKKEILSIVDEYIKLKSIPAPEVIAELEELRSGKAIADEKLAKFELDSQSLLDSIKKLLVSNFNLELADDMSAEMFSEMVKTITIDDAAEGFVPTPGMASAAKRALEWRAEFKRGGTGVGVARARDIMNKKELSPSTVMRMKSFFARHEVDKKASGFNQGEEGFPSPGRIAWDLWGGDGGKSWANAKAAQIERMRTEDSVKGPWVMGDFVYNEPVVETAIEESFKSSVEDTYTPEKTYTTPSTPTFAVGDFVSYRLDSKGNEVGVSSGSLGEQDDAAEMKEGYGVIDAMHSKGTVTHGPGLSVDASEEDPATILTIAKMGEDGLYDKTEEVTVKKRSELRKIMAPIVWSKKETPPLGAYPSPGIGG